MHVIDLSDTTSVNLLQQTLNQNTYDEINNACAIKIVSLTKECNDLLERIASCPPSLSSIRRLMKYDEFPDNSHFDPYLHNDYDFIHGIVFHLLKLCESPMNPIGQKLRERTAAIWSTFPIINSLSNLNVLHDDLESSKIDGLTLKRESNSMIILIELAGGCHTNTEKKLESDCFKIYKNAIKTLTKHNQYYVRERNLKLSMPQNPRDLKSFAALLPTLLSWRQAAIDLAE
ncbi:hypothetical protein INT48_001225 [Thamnidium elegans]|uniref:Uncharacterized protein n=1 Tax=Thamnidium elegans TaxID=101142 RepID=A0A8H7SNG2_9FUNG|nr:hypothetical protein INT48_001225 [Thamnidium elegans]